MKTNICDECKLPYSGYPKLFLGRMTLTFEARVFGDDCTLAHDLCGKCLSQHLSREFGPTSNPFRWIAQKFNRLFDEN